MLENQRQFLGLHWLLVFHIGKIAIGTLTVFGYEILLRELPRFFFIGAAYGKGALFLNGQRFFR